MPVCYLGDTTVFSGCSYMELSFACTWVLCLLTVRIAPLGAYLNCESRFYAIQPRNLQAHTTFRHFHIIAIIIGIIKEFWWMQRGYKNHKQISLFWQLRASNVFSMQHRMKTFSEQMTALQDIWRFSVCFWGAIAKPVFSLQCHETNIDKQSSSVKNYRASILTFIFVL